MGFVDVIDAEDTLTKKQLISLARTSESAERYEDMCSVMKRLVDVVKQNGDTLQAEERNLLSVAYKNVVGARRASLRTLNSEPADSDDKAGIIAEYKLQLQKELQEICGNINAILGDFMNSKHETDEAQIFYKKMAADYYRYLAECVDGGENKTKCIQYYEDAYEIASKVNQDGEATLPPTHPIRLGLALNYSVALYEIVQKPTEACDLAKSAFDDAIAQLDKLEESDYKDSTLIMQLLRDNLTLWTANNEN